jgi:ribose transport system substrate-binding protein
MQRGAEEAAKRLDVDLVVQAADREIDVERQMQIIENLIQSKVSALAITPAGSREVVPAVGKANAAGIPTIIVDTRLDPKASADAGVKTVSFIGSDNVLGGKLMGDYLVKASNGTAKVAILEGIPGHETGDSRVKGFRGAVAAAPGIAIVASQHANWERDQGFTVFQNMLQAHPEIDTVFACNDTWRSVQSRRSPPPDGPASSRPRLRRRPGRAGDRRGTMEERRAVSDEMGRVAIESAVKTLKGERCPDQGAHRARYQENAKQ